MTPDQLETRLHELRAQWRQHPERRAEIEAEAAAPTAPSRPPLTSMEAAAVQLLTTVLGATLLGETAEINR